MAMTNDERMLKIVQDAPIAVEQEPFSAEHCKQIVALALEICRTTAGRFAAAVDKNASESAEARAAEARLADHREHGVIAYDHLLAIATSAYVQLGLNTELLDPELERAHEALPTTAVFSCASIDDQQAAMQQALRFGTRVAGSDNPFVLTAEQWLRRNAELNVARKRERQEERVATTALQQQREDTLREYTAARSLVEAALRLERSRTPIDRLMPSAYNRRRVAKSDPNPS